MILGGLLLLTALMMFSTGLMGEVLMRIYFESRTAASTPSAKSSHSTRAAWREKRGSRWSEPLRLGDESR
jgi:hypothetical protein